MCPQVFRPLVIACLVIASSACQPQRSGIQSKNMGNVVAGYVEPAGAGPAGALPVSYLGDMFSGEEAALASKPPEIESPTF